MLFRVAYTWALDHRLSFGVIRMSDVEPPPVGHMLVHRVREWLGAWRRASYSEHRITDVESWIATAESRLERLEHAVLITRADAQEWFISPSVSMSEWVDMTGEQADDALYLAFEDKFYPTDMVTTFQTEYVQYVEKHLMAAECRRIVDIGCGRGEFLDVLSAAGIEAEGVETNAAEVATLRARGHTIHHGDANSFLKGCEDGSISIITALQVIEHMTPGYFMEFMRLVGRKAAPHAMVIIETPNPKCSSVQTMFYTDLTHVRPYPMETTRFYLAAMGFEEFVAAYSGLAPEHALTLVAEFNYVNYGLIASRHP